MCHNATFMSMKLLVYNSLLSVDVGLVIVLCVLFGSFANSVFFNSFLELRLCLFLQLLFFELLTIFLFSYCLVLSVTTIAFCELT